MNLGFGSGETEELTTGRVGQFSTLPDADNPASRNRARCGGDGVDECGALRRQPRRWSVCAKSAVAARRVGAVHQSFSVAMVYSALNGQPNAAELMPTPAVFSKLSAQRATIWRSTN
jgi:hypothetical protein